MALFQPGQKSPGRAKGARNRISTALLEAIAEDFEKHGWETIAITRIERPTDYLKIAASLLPREFEIVDNRLQEIPDDELDAIIELARQRRLTVINVDRREDETPDRKPALLLSSVSKTS